MTFAPRRGLVTFVVGFPVFLGLRAFFTVVLGRAVDWHHDLVWACVMAIAFGVIATFTRTDA